jgi:GNAT superfamily N-acetyltransferase
MTKYKIREIPMPRAELCRAILKALPDWFGIESALETYAAETERYLTFGAYDSDERIVGFMTLRGQNRFTNEIYVMAVLPSHHSKGIGSLLVSFAKTWSRARGFELLEVKTLGPSKPDPFYDRTRDFYSRMGFRPVEEFEGVWEGNPCLVMVMAL